MMRDAIIDFPKQLGYEPEVVNGEKLEPSSEFLVCGMGGSHLAADILKWVANVPVHIHEDYGLPPLREHDRMLVILSSYSGNTEEVLDAYDEAKRRGLRMAAVSVGGTLLARAEADGIPFIKLPDMGIQPRLALGFSFKALARLMNLGDISAEAATLGLSLNPLALEEQGKELAAKLRGRVPVVYSSTRNRSVVYNWKIKLNETGKVPAFYNVFPELNHNEMNGFDPGASSKKLMEPFHFIFLTDEDDHPRVEKRMAILADLYRERGFPVDAVPLRGSSHLEKIFSSVLLADWVALGTAEQYGLESEQVPMVEHFKELMK